VERRKAMAYAATSALILSSGLVAGAAVGGFNVLGFGGQFSSVIAGAEGTVPTTAATASEAATTPPPIYVTKYSIVDDYVVVTTATTAAPTTAAVAAAAAPAASPTTPATQAAPTAYPSFDVVPSEEDPSSPDTTARSYTPTTTNSGYPSGVPSSWPADQPVPPKPANCHDARLTLDGIWHCEVDD
jgi:hypothetical protein